MFTVAPRATSRPVAWLVCGRPFTPPFICPTSFYFTKRDNQHSGWNSNFRICRVDFWIGYFELFQRNFGLKFECQFNDSYHKKINIKSVTRTSSRHAKRSASTMRQRLKVDAATEEDEPGWSSGLQVSENEPGWVQVESPKNSFGSGLQVSENLQSYMQTGNQMTTEEYKRGRKLLSEKKAIEETEKAKARQAALAKEEWDTVKHYFLVGTIFLFLVWAFFRFGPVLKKNNAPGNTNNPVVQQLKESANEAFGEPLANILLPGLRI